MQNNPCQACIWCSIFLMKPDIFRILIYSYPGNCGIFRTLSSVNDKIFNSKPLSIAYLDCWYIQNLRLFRTQGIQYRESLKFSLHRTMFNLGIFMALVYLSPNILRVQWKLRNLSNMYDGLFSTEPCITLLYSEFKAYSGPCQISMMKNVIHNLV